MKYSDFFKKLKSGEISPVYLFTGEETFVMNSALNKLIAAVVDEDLKAVNLVRLPENASGEEIASAAETVPFMAQKRMVIVENSAFLQKGSPEGEERLEEYLSKPEPNTVLVFLSPLADKRKRIYKALSKHAVVEFDTLSDAELSAWCVKEIKARGLEISVSDAAFLCEYTDPSPAAMVNEIDKLAAFCTEKKVTKDDIYAIVTPCSDYNMFRMTDALSAGDAKNALKMLDGLLAQKEDPFYILGAVTKQYRQFLRFKAMEGAPKQEVISSLGIRDFVFNKYAAVCRKYSEKQLLLAVDICAETDAGLKSGAKNPDTALFELAAKLALIPNKK